MRTPGDTPKKSRAKLAVQSVQKENNYPQTIDTNTDALIPNRKTDQLEGWRKEYKYINRKGEEVGLSRKDIINLGKDYVDFVLTEPLTARLLVKNTFWKVRGISYKKVGEWCKLVPEFAELFEMASEAIGVEREARLIDDVVHIRNRQSVYLPEYKEHDKEMLEFRERIRSMIEKQSELSYEQQQGLFNEFMESAIGAMKQNANARDASQRRPKLDKDAGGDTPATK
jgi:hypothetical protein